MLAAQGSFVEARLPCAAVGDGARIEAAGGSVTGVVASVRGGVALIAAHGSLDGVACGDKVYADPWTLAAPLGTVMLGRCVDAAARPMDGGEELRSPRRSVRLRAPAPAERVPLHAPLWTGIRAIDGLLTIARGARVGIFGAPGAGKSTLLHGLARFAYADAVVIALVGERGREAEEWMRVAPRHACIVCATSDRTAAERVRAAHLAMAQAGELRGRGLHVVMVLDSLARYSNALREIAAAAQEPAGRGGFPASVFADLARYVEVAGAANGGSVTLLASVLSDGDERDPVSDAARSLLDGHIELSPRLAQSGHFPAINVPASASRTMACAIAPEHAGWARTVRAAIGALAETAEARVLGVQPADERLLAAVGQEPAVNAFLRQDERPSTYGHTLSQLARLADTLE